MIDLDAALKHWRQGDYSLDVGGFLFAAPTVDDSGFDFEVGYETDDIIGYVVISQTCDIIRCSGGRFFVAVCPLIRVKEEDINAISKGRQPYLTDVENTDRGIFADIRRVMTVHKRLLEKWKHQSGFTSNMQRQRFAAALERKFGQFAFPDDFNQAIKYFRERVWSRHSKSESEPGKVYRSLMQIRFRAEPSWNAKQRKISVIAIMNQNSDREVDREVISKELKYSLEKIQWPYGYEWKSSKLVLGTVFELTAEDVIYSQRGDFEFLCY